MLGFYNYSVILTYLGLASSVFGITQVIEVYKGQGNYSIAFLCLLFSGLCDLFDGRIARMKKNRTDREKVFGIQIDSLCDLVCFGVFPGILGYSFGMNYGLGLVSAIAIILAAVIRLGYFNTVEQERQATTSEKRHEYRGLPVTTVAIILPIIYIAIGLVGKTLFPIIFQVCLIIIALLFLIKFKVRKPQILGVVLLILIGTIILIAIFNGRLD